MERVKVKLHASEGGSWLIEPNTVVNELYLKDVSFLIDEAKQKIMKETKKGTAHLWVCGVICTKEEYQLSSLSEVSGWYSPFKDEGFQSGGVLLNSAIYAAFNNKLIMLKGAK